MVNDLFKSKAAEMVLKSYLQAKEQDEKKRRELANDRLSIYHDEWKDILEAILAAQFHKDNYAKIKLLKNTTQNILKKVVNEISVVYKQAPVRDYRDHEVIASIYDYLNINEFMRRVNRYGSLLNDPLIRVGWDNQLQRITLDINTPANTSVIQRDNYPEQAAGVYYDIDYIDDKFKAETLQVFWSDYEHFMFNEKGDKRPPTEDNPEMLNPYGKLPFVIVHMDQIPGMFWNPSGGSDLVDGTTITGMKRTFKDYLFKSQSFKQGWLRADNAKDIPNELLSDPLTFFKLTGEGSAAGYLDMTAAFAELEVTLQADINAFLATYGLSVDMFATSPDESSGKALNIKNRGLREIRENQLPIFRRVESELFDMIRLVYNTYNKGGIPDDLKFKIDFAELETYIEPMERRRQSQWDVQNGIISPGQFYMEFNPDIIDEDEAETKMAENLAKYKNMKNQGFSFDQFINTTTGEILPGKNFGDDTEQQSTPGNISGVNMFGAKGKPKDVK